ncbi:MAG: hypothetical protein IJ123_08030 [Blautia sp.]|nr:hypothetical protein [Blautia sp.]
MKKKPTRFSLRRLNAVITGLILILFLIHAMFGVFQMLGAAGTWHKRIAGFSSGLIVIHLIIGIKLTADTLKVQRRTGTAYFKENRLFWARRISGVAVMILLFFHMAAFTTAVEGQTRLVWFNGYSLLFQIFFVLSLALHIISNVKPLLISFGVSRLKELSFDILFVLSILMLVMTAGFIVYYFRWNG